MSDEIKSRLQDTTADCVKRYEAWVGDKKNADARAALQEAVHEVRKVASRLEIELAVHERDIMASKPIPIPPHRDARGRHQSADDDKGNRAESDTPQQKPQRTRPRPNKPKSDD